MRAVLHCRADVFSSIITQLFKTLNGYGFDGKNGFETNPNYTTNI
jgi:purine nucleosidase